MATLLMLLLENALFHITRNRTTVMILEFTIGFVIVLFLFVMFISIIL